MPKEGWCTEAKAFALADIIVEAKPMVCVEIGVFGGRSLIPQGVALRENGSGIVYGIDPWRIEAALEGELPKEDKDWWGNKVDLEYVHRSCMESIWKNDLAPWIVILRCGSEHCHQLFKSGIDLLHIDGTHSELCSVRDYKNYLPLVNSGGHVVFDDIDWPTTHQALKLVSDCCQMLKDVGSCRFFRKS